MTAVVTLTGTVYGNFILERGDAFVIGRSLQTDLSVDDLRISRRHTRIEHEEHGVTATDLRSALYPSQNRPRVISFIAGLGGREVSTDNVIDLTGMVFDAANGGGIDDQETHWIGVRE